MSFFPCNNHNFSQFLLISGITRRGNVYTKYNDQFETFDLSSFSGFHSWKIEDFFFRTTRSADLTFPREAASAYYTPTRVYSWNSDTGEIVIFKSALTSRSVSGSYAVASAVDDLYVIT